MVSGGTAARAPSGDGIVRAAAQSLEHAGAAPAGKSSGIGVRTGRAQTLLRPT